MTLDRFNKDDILKARLRGRTERFHPIVFLFDNSPLDFIEAMITHSSSYKGHQNVAMRESHFEKIAKLGGVHSSVYDNTHLVPKKFIKPQSWGPFTVEGRLSGEGIIFVERQVQHCSEETFDDYFKSIVKIK